MATRRSLQAEHQERLRRSAGLPEPALDGVLQIPHPFHGGVGETRTRDAARAKQLEAAYDFSPAGRTQLHYLVSRPTDALTKNHPTGGRAESRLRRAFANKRIEKFMQDFYSHSRNIFIITRTLEQRLAFIRRPPSRLSLRRYLPRAGSRAGGWLQIHQREIHATNNQVFRDQPRRLMRVFLTPSNAA